ncbi:hypothetical protein TPELB_21170 [Terrisporobacter petrolearius]|uniref:Phage gp6-like head-tail connector protein n=1 Tax=Terrisporobacter petrolearius TaxID=1460447 RepID=A0ABZ3FGE0_9FIRM
MNLDNIKLKLGITDNKEDDLLTILLYDAINYMKVYLQADIIPIELEFIAEEVSIKRYRRIGSECISTEKVDVLSTSYKSNDFSDYYNLMNIYKKKTKKGFKFF